MGKLKNKVALITGGTSGIGAETARLFIQEGAKVVISGRSKEKGSKLAEELGKNAYYCLSDITKEEDIKRAISFTTDKLSKLDILFNNAGVSQFGYFEESDLSVLDKIMELDFFSVVQFTKSILPHMIAKKSGQIVTNTSVAGLVGSRNRSFYSSAKFALHGFFDSVRSEIIHHNVHVTLIAPGRVATDVGKNALTASGQPYGKDDRGHNKGLTSKQAAKRILTAIKKKKREAVIAKWNDIAWLAVYIRKLAPRLYFFLARRIVA